MKFSILNYSFVLAQVSPKYGLWAKFGLLRFFIQPAKLFKNIYTHFEPRLDRIILEAPQFHISNTNQD